MAEPAATSTHVVDRYLAEIRGRELLSRDEEQAVARRAVAGCAVARRRLVESNLGFVVAVAKPYRTMGVPFEDLLNEGNLGLIQAAARFDPANGTRFVTYAVWWIRKSILEALNRDSSVVRVPGGQRRRAREVRDAENLLLRRLGRRPDRGEVSRHLARRPEQIEEVLRLRPSRVGLDDESPGTSGLTIGESIPDHRHDDPEAGMARDEATRLVAGALATLSERERDVVRQRFGLGGEPPLTLNELGARLGLSRERVRQIESRALTRLRRRLVARRFDRRADRPASADAGPPARPLSRAV